MNQVGKDRKLLRHEILKDFAGIESKKIFEALKQEELPFITFDDLKPYYERCKLSREKLNDIFSVYNVFVQKISPKKFISFLEDEVTCKMLEENINPNLTENQLKILTKFVEGLKTHRTTPITGKQSGGSRKDLASAKGSNVSPTRLVSDATFTTITERTSLSSIWLFVLKYNPSNTKSDRYVRLAALCRIADELNLSFTTEDFIDAIFAFFDQKIDQLDFQQFVKLIQTFP